MSDSFLPTFIIIRTFKVVKDHDQFTPYLSQCHLFRFYKNQSWMSVYVYVWQRQGASYLCAVGIQRDGRTAKGCVCCFYVGWGWGLYVWVLGGDGGEGLGRAWINWELSSSLLRSKHQRRYVREYFRGWNHTLCENIQWIHWAPYLSR